MTKNTWMSVPAGALGQGIADARPYPGVALRMAIAPRVAPQGTGLPIARLRDLGQVVGTAALGAAPTGTTCTPRGDFFAQNDGTTLGFHTSSRPLS
jgi:hypothetical protein